MKSAIDNNEAMTDNDITTNNAASEDIDKAITDDENSVAMAMAEDKKH